MTEYNRDDLFEAFKAGWQISSEGFNAEISPTMHKEQQFKERFEREMGLVSL